jgi:Abhydrolase family
MCSSRAAILLLALAAWTEPATAQVRVKPQSARGGEPQGEPWTEVPETFRHLKLPDWAMPTDLERWQQVDRARTRDVVVKLLGDLPPRPDPAKVEVVAREEHNGYILERFRFHNGVDAVVPGVLLLPTGRKGPSPAVVALHGHSGSKDRVLTTTANQECIGPELARKGYVVAAIDSYFCGDRIGRGPAGRLDQNRNAGEEESLFKLNLWLAMNPGPLRG